MKLKFVSLTMIIGTLLLLSIGITSCNTKNESTVKNLKAQVADSVLRHVVLFKFKETTSAEDLANIESTFAKLPLKINEIQDFEWGLNNSPEGLEKGFTHCFFVTFNSEAGRDIYLPHPDHKAFVEIASPHIEDVLVVDYWTKK
ncbi:MAG: Dabb family protein [Croceitalea sp.]|nr:Dabb family protein [Croceitalea sp.]